MSLKKVIIVPDVYDRKTWQDAEVESVAEYLTQQFKTLPENVKIYHNVIAESCNVTPKNEADIEKLEKLEGIFFIVIYPSWLQFVYYAIVAIMAAYSVYTILTMPKADTGSVGSANNELAQRTNQARLNSRIPDILGLVRAYADLIAQTFTFYNTDGIEVEECLMVIGRGYYQILDCRDGDTSVNGIDGVAVSIYDPGTNIAGPDTIYRIGDAFNTLPLAVRKSSAINGQALLQPNDVSVESESIYFTTGGVIRTDASDLDFTDSFVSGDRITLSNAVFGVANIELSGICVVSVTSGTSYFVEIQSALDITDFANFKGIQLTGATFEIIDEVENEDGSITTSSSFRDLSGQYDVSSISRTLSDDKYTYRIILSSPKQINYNWNFVTEAHTISAGLVLNKNINSMILDETYSIANVQEKSITLVSAQAINSDWAKLETLFNGSTQGQASKIIIEIVANKWIGWFDIYKDDATALSLNIYFQNGLWNQDKNGKTNWAFVDITVEYQMIDDVGEPISDILSYVYQSGRVTKKYSFGITLDIDLPQIGNVRFRAAKTAAHSGNNTQADCKIKDVYLTSAYDKPTYDGVTVLRSLTVATDGALSVKERKLNCLVNRKLEVDGTGELQVTRSAGQALIHMALDEYVGRRSSAEIDINQINTEIAKINAYFNSDVMSEFNYTIDDENLSFEEIAGMISSAAFCEPYRFGNVTRMKFEQPQPNSVLLFNHRNKVPQSEKRTYTFGIQKDYDGIELEYTADIDDARIKYIIPENSTPKNPLKITTTGIRNEAQAKTRAWREWNKLRYKYVTCEFDALDESELLIRNDRILSADNTLIATQDGYVAAVDGLTITTSQPCFFEENTVHYLYFQLPDATVDMIQCEKGEDEYSIILSRPPLQPLFIDADAYIVTTYVLVRAEERVKQAFMLEELTPATQMTNTLKASNYDDRFYEEDHSFI